MRIGLIADIHEDIVGLRKAFRILESAQCNEVICLGDIVGFRVNAYDYLDTRSAHECVAMIRANCSVSVVGNNDIYQIKKIPIHGGGFEFPENWYELDYFERKALAKDSVFLYEDVQLSALLTSQDKAWLESLPEYAVNVYDGTRVMYSHFCFPDLVGVRAYFPKMAQEFSAHIHFMLDHDCDLGFSGHMHYEGISTCNGHSLKRSEFSCVALESERQWVFGPCVARGKFDNGVMIWDTNEREISAIPLSANASISDSDRFLPHEVTSNLTQLSS